uniref:Uncharacterized protein n=1 Tax=Vespula pensylvanica TaxID=30213 RepID=A0A834P4D1_VESPE|nr:hypothetical protein H0235_007135 [Vespula pensylvanica]
MSRVTGRVAGIGAERYESLESRPIVIQTIKRIPKHEVAVSKQYSITVSTAVAAVDGGATAAVAVAVATVTIAATAVRDTCYDKSRK